MMDKANPLADPRRTRGEDRAFRAERAWATGKEEEARRLFAEAAALEEEVAREVEPTSPRVRSLLAISAVALWYKASDFDRAKRVAYHFLAGDGLGRQGRREIEQLVDRCSRESEVRQLTRAGGFVPIEVRLLGGRVGFGVAPARAARDRRDTVTSLLARTAELSAGLPYQERGDHSLHGGVQLRVFEAPAIAASYSLRFYLAAPERKRRDGPLVTPEHVVERFLALGEAAGRGPAAIRALVPDERYAQAFIAGFGEIAPDGDDVERVECSAPSWQLANAPRLVFEPRDRSVLHSDRTALRWWKVMASTDALQNPGNERAYVQLTKSKQPIDHATWFRKKLFRDAAWQSSGGGDEEEAEMAFDVSVLTVPLGCHVFRVSHLRARAKHHSSPATRLHWNATMRALLERSNFTGSFLVLQRDVDGRYQLLIVDAPPMAVS